VRPSINKTKHIIMETAIHLQAEQNSQAVDTAKSLRTLYFTRTAFSIVWVILVSFFGRKSAPVASILLIIYPIWDVVGTILDIRANRNNSTSKIPQYVNIGISSVTALVFAYTLQQGIVMTLIAFGAWAILTGLIQFILGLRRKKTMEGQWPMIISGAQSVLGGTANIILAHNTAKGIPGLATYVAFGAFYFLLAAIRLNKTIKANTAVA
jgi:uncharacterized membrane protein HdeD (DUF308 family)